MKRFHVFFLFAVLLFFVSTANAHTPYTVKKGDSLYKISNKFGIPKSEIKKANNLKSNELRAGAKLIIPKKDKSDKASKNTKKKNNETGDKMYRVKKGDNIWRIAKKFNISMEELKEINGLTSNSLKAGQEIVVSKSAFETKEPEDIIKSIQVQNNRKATSVITSARLEEVKELSISNDLSKMSIKERLILLAKKMLHFPYKFGGNGPLGLDCSAYVQKVYGMAGLELPRSAREQFRIGESVDREYLAAGDLVFFRTYASFPSHVGIYLGDNLFIHASTRAKKVIIDSFESPYYVRRFIGAKRLIEEDEVETTEPSEVWSKEK